MASESDYESYYLTWFDSSYGDAGAYGEPLSSSQDECYDDTYYLIYDEDEDYSNRPWYTDGVTNQDYGGTETPYRGGGTWLGDFTSYFGSFWGESVYGADGRSLEKEDSSVYEGGKYGSHCSYNDNMQPDYSGNQWAGNVDDHPYNSSWDNWEEKILYEKLFGH